MFCALLKDNYQWEERQPVVVLSPGGKWWDWSVKYLTDWDDGAVITQPPMSRDKYWPLQRVRRLSQPLSPNICAPLYLQAPLHGCRRRGGGGPNRDSCGEMSCPRAKRERMEGDSVWTFRKENETRWKKKKKNPHSGSVSSTFLCRNGTSLLLKSDLWIASAHISDIHVIISSENCNDNILLSPIPFVNAGADELCAAVVSSGASGAAFCPHTSKRNVFFFFIV